jgi:predicted DNA-binding antitoxin AbrB/MazE fold protein
MKSYQKSIRLENTSNLVLDNLPFKKGEEVEIIIIPKNQNRKKLVAELKQLLKETQALHSEKPLTEAEIQAEIDAVRREECE